MEDTRRRRSGGLRKLITAVFAVAFVASIISTVTAFAAANLFKIENAELSELSTTAEGSISSFDETNIVSNVTFHKLNDSAKYTITLKNTDSKDHVIESITDDNESPYISYLYDQHANEQINAGENLVFEVTAKYTTAITDINQRAQATSVRFFIHFTDLEEEIPIVPNTGTNPNTGDFIHFSVLSLVISAAGLTIIGIIALKKHKKASKFIAAGIIAVAAIATTATVKAATVEINSFTINTSYALNDRLIVTYTDKNGDEQELIVNYGEPVNIPDQSKDGYTLTGWEDENGNPVDPTQPITEDIKIHPAYRAHTYTIKFNGNGATSGEMTDLAMTFGEAKTLPANAFTWAGHEYTGWDTEANGSGAHYGDAVEVTDLTTEDNVIVVLYAQWSVNPFHIDYDGNGATSGEMATTNCEYDQACQLRDNAFEKYGYDFAGWKYNDTTYADKADVTNIIDHGTITMQAQWTPHVYTITYTGLTSEEATTLRTAGNPDTYTIESPSFTLKNPEDRKDADGDTRERFVGWVEVIEPSTSVTLPMVGNLGNKTFNATWETVALPEYDITYDYDGGNVATANPTKLTKEQSATLNEPTKTGYTFTGWTGTTITGSTPVKPYTIPAPHQKGNLEYTAHYRAHTYTVNFDINTDDTHVSGTMQPLVFSYDEEKALTANAFTRTGYTFAGWKLGDNEYTDGQTIENLTAEDGATITLKAQWTPNQFIINFHANDTSATGIMLPQVVTYDEQTTLRENNFKKEHYKFMGWATSENGAVAYADQADATNAVSEANGTLDLYAVWLERTSTLDTGSNVNAALRDLTAAPTTFKRFDGENLPDFDALDGKVDIALASSNFPVWAWADGDTIYWWSEAEAPKLNDQSNGFFTGRTKLSNNQYEDNSLKNLTTIDMVGLDVSTATNMDSIFAYESNLETLNLGDFNAASARNMSSMFINTTSLKNLDLSKFESPAAINMSSMFNGSGVTSLDLSQIESSTVTNMTNMFYGVKMDSLDASKLNTSSATAMDGMFRNATIGSLKFYDQENPSASLFDTSNVQTMNNMFSSTNTATIDVSNFNTSKVTSLSSTFSRTTASTINVAGWNTSKVTNMSSTFLGVTLADLNLSHFNTAQVTTMQQMFDDATIINLNLSGWTNDRVTNMSYMFRNFGRFGSNELHIDFTNFKTPALKSMFHMFDGYNAMNLKVLDLSSFDTSNVTNMQYAFGSTEANAGIRVFDTIYASDKFVVSDAIGDNITIFGRNGYNGYNLIGGAGTVWNDTNPKTKEYARIDDPCNNKPGYFTLKNHQYICFYANNGTDARKGQYVSTTASDQLEKNEFTREGFRFLGWAESDDATAPLYTDEAAITLAYIGKEPKNLYAVWEPATYTISFDKNDEYATGEMNTQTVTYTATETLNANTFTNYQHTFLGWNTQADGKGTHYDNRAEIEITIPHDFTLYAEWKAELQSAYGNSIDLTMLSADKANEDVQIDEDTKCKRAVQLHEEICESGHCTDLGYTETGSKGTNVVRYGSFGTQGGPLNSGDAFTCDVDGNGVFDEKYERFYYVSDYWNTKTREFEGDTAVLIYYRSTYLGQGTTSQMTSSYSSQVTSGPTISNLPKSSLWQNVSLKNTKRDILAFREGEEMAITIEDFDYEGYSARLLTIPEAKAGCNVATIQGNGAETDSTCMYMYENSRFVINDFSTESIGVPLENTYIGTTSSEDNYRWFIQSRNIGGGAGFHPTSASTRVSMRPVIEVPKNKISY